ncbi:hypothetical protein [Siphonobacter sp.]|uniref:hypothetical protein n=1 Tax=Siphonobacter sp. TaxID=1869184 RepID=UPI003B3ADE2D
MNTTKNAPSVPIHTTPFSIARTLTLKRLQKVSKFRNRLKPYPILVLIISGLLLTTGLVQILVTLVGAY